MDVVAVLPLYPPSSRVGAFLATHELLADLAHRGHHVQALTRRANQEYDLDGVHVSGGEDTQTVSDAILAANVVLSHAGDDGKAADLARLLRRPSVRMVHGWHEDLPARLLGADLVVFNSHACAAEACYDGRQIVVRPQLHPDVAAMPGDRVTLVNLSEPKGGELFWRLARNAPQVQFLGVRGGWGNQLIARAPNVEIVASTERIGEVFARTRVLLMPSARETWGMTGVEAMGCGIPVIAHPTEGLRESLGGAGIFVDRDDGQGWLDQIERLQDPEEWSRASERALARFAELDLSADLERFARAVGGLHEGDAHGVSETDGRSSEVRRGGEVGQGQDRRQREEGLEPQEVTA